jgi:NitT/TauT family transport system substrate-binding protein
MKGFLVMTKKLSVIFLLFLSFSVDAFAKDKLDKLVLAGPIAPVTYPLIYMVEKNRLQDVAEITELKIWNDPGQLRAMIAGRQADFLAVPTNVAANFYNRGVDLKLINVSIWGILWVVSRDANISNLLDIKGQEVVMPFKGDMPDLVFRNLALKQGLDPDRDFKIRYVDTPMDAAQQLIMKRADHAVLTEPLVSTVLLKSKESGAGLHRSINLQKVWGDAYKTKAKIPQAGIAVMANIKSNPKILEIFQREYAAAIQWIRLHPEEMGKLVQKYIRGLKPEPVVEALRHVPLKFVTAQEARTSLERFFGALKEGNPASIGGKLPEGNFYGK